MTPAGQIATASRPGSAPRTPGASTAASLSQTSPVDRVYLVERHIHSSPERDGLTAAYTAQPDGWHPGNPRDLRTAAELADALSC